MDVARSEVVEADLDRFIATRSRRSKDLDADGSASEELWKESVRRYNARRREENRQAWCDYFARLAGSLRARAEEYDGRAERLMQDSQEIGEA
jgi:hypothetical protein